MTSIKTKPTTILPARTSPISLRVREGTKSPDRSAHRDRTRRTVEDEARSVTRPKERWQGCPIGYRVELSNSASWGFPSGTSGTERVSMKVRRLRRSLRACMFTTPGNGSGSQRHVLSSRCTGSRAQRPLCVIGPPVRSRPLQARRLTRRSCPRSWRARRPRWRPL